jgi:hypothetical protein
MTQNDEAKTAIQDTESLERIQDTIALVNILALGNRQIEAGQVQPAVDVMVRLRQRLG